ncbi:MAG: tagaturonate reductase [Thermonemataceae bacterium]
MPLLHQQLITSHQYTSDASLKLAVPSSAHFQYPEKVLQFGTGVLLRGLPDYFIDQANKKGHFKGRILVVKSTSGDTQSFDQQDGLYTLVVRGLEEGIATEKYIVNSAISRVLSAQQAWKEIIASASNEVLQVVISNTTEVGIQYVEEDIFQTPPTSYPAKLTAWLYARYQHFKNDSPHTVIIPTELIPNNAGQLQSFVKKHSTRHQLGEDFGKWLDEIVTFCGSLVDRIVTGLPETQEAEEMYKKLGFEDKLLAVTEPYKLWAIEGSDKVKEILTFALEQPDIIITPDITYYRERKLRILNGSHTISVPLGFISGLDTVLDCMKDEQMSRFFTEVIHQEIVPTIPQADLTDLSAFADDILNRYRNPYLVHKLINITLQSTSKMRMRNVPTLLRYVAKEGKIPEKMALGFAAYLFFMRVTHQEGDQFYGMLRDQAYPINDDQAAYFHSLWQKINPPSPNTLEKYVREVSSNQTLWETDLTQLPQFVSTVTKHLEALLKKSLKSTV